MLPSVKESAENGIFENDNNITTLFCGGVENPNSHSIWSLIGGVFCFSTHEEVDYDTIPNQFNATSIPGNSSKKVKVFTFSYIIKTYNFSHILLEKKHQKYMEI
jgi:hypothetical protein